MRFTEQEHAELRIMRNALHQAGIELPDKEAQRFNSQELDDGCTIFDLDAWYDEVASLYDELFK